MFEISFNASNCFTKDVMSILMQKKKKFDEITTVDRARWSDQLHQQIASGQIIKYSPQVPLCCGLAGTQYSKFGSRAIMMD